MRLGLTREVNDCVALAQRHAEALGRERFGPDLLLAGLLKDGAVIDALGRAGVAPKAVRSAAGVGSEVEPHQRQQPSGEAFAILRRVRVEARSREHFFSEPGHVLLAMTHQADVPGYGVLLALTQELARMRERLEELLPTNEMSEEEIRRRLECFPPLSPGEVRGLAREVVRWHRSGELIRVHEEELGPDERGHLEWRRGLQTAPTFLMARHHCYLAMAAAEQCAKQGHRLRYAYYLAQQKLLDTAYAFREPESDFTETARTAIQAILRKRLGCSVSW